MAIEQMKKLLTPLLVSVGLTLVACSASAPSLQLVQLVSDPALFEKSELNFIHAGATTRDEIIFRMGNPAARFEDDRILIYQVGFESSGKVHFYAPRLFGGETRGASDWERGTFSLVLVFTADGVLTKHNLVSTE